MSVHTKIPSAKKVAWISFLVDIGDISLNLFVAIISGSVIMTAEWLQGLADFFSSGLILFGVKNSSKRPDKKHPFGYGRELYFWTLISTVIMLIVTSGISFFLGWKRLVYPEPITNIPLVVSVLFIGFCSNAYAVIQNTKRLILTSKQTSVIDAVLHSSMVEVRTNIILDLSGVLASLTGLISMLIYQLTGNLLLDGLGTIIIAFFISIFSIFLLIHLRGFIIGQSVDLATETKIIDTIKTFPSVIDVLDIRTSIIGPQKFLVNVEIHAKPNLKTKQLEKLIDQIKQKCTQSVPQIAHIQVELETP